MLTSDQEQAAGWISVSAGLLTGLANFWLWAYIFHAFVDDDAWYGLPLFFTFLLITVCSGMVVTAITLVWYIKRVENAKRT